MKKQNPYQNILIEEIIAEIDLLIEKKIVVDMNAVASKICSNHLDELVDEAPFSTYNIGRNVRREVNQVMKSKFSIDPQQQSGQLTITGYQFIQCYYSIKREGEYIGVPIEQMTHEERRLKIEELRKMGKTCFLHASELEQYDMAQLTHG